MTGHLGVLDSLAGLDATYCCAATDGTAASSSQLCQGSEELLILYVSERASTSVGIDIPEGDDLCES